MRLHYFEDHPLPDQARKLVDFDVESVMHVIAAQHDSPPAIWLVDPNAYEKNGRIQRDSASPRLLAYSSARMVIYATDGCNSCHHRVPAPIEKLSRTQLESFSQDTQIRIELLERLVELART